MIPTPDSLSASSTLSHSLFCFIFSAKVFTLKVTFYLMSFVFCFFFCFTNLHFCPGFKFQNRICTFRLKKNAAIYFINSFIFTLAMSVFVQIVKGCHIGFIHTKKQKKSTIFQFKKMVLMVIVSYQFQALCFFFILS